MDEAFFAAMEPRIQKAFADMDALEKGAIANPDEKRMVGHYWLRNPGPGAHAGNPPGNRGHFRQNQGISRPKSTPATSRARAANSRTSCSSASAARRSGPQFVAQALGNPRKDKLKPFFFDNTDPDGMNRTLAAIGKKLDRTLCIVISKSGGTKETRNGMLVAQAAYEKAGLNFGQHAVAVTMFGSELDKYTLANQWLERFPMWDWVGGRTSELSAVGLLAGCVAGN